MSVFRNFRYSVITGCCGGLYAARFPKAFAYQPTTTVSSLNRNSSDTYIHILNNVLLILKFDLNVLS